MVFDKMTEEEKKFALEVIDEYGEDRFYHACLRTSDHLTTARIYKEINEQASGIQISQFLNSLGIDIADPSTNFYPPEKTGTEAICRIIYALFKYKKEFAIRTNKLPDTLHNRMVLAINNEWVKKYIELIPLEKKDQETKDMDVLFLKNYTTRRIEIAKNKNHFHIAITNLENNDSSLVFLSEIQLKEIFEELEKKKEFFNG